MLIASGIPVARADFHSAVNNGDNVPENFFSCDSAAKSRQVEMWLTVGGNLLLCKHKDKYFFVPAASIKFGRFK